MSLVLADRYELRTRIGSGGMATVWRAFDRRLGREVAVKVLSESLAADERFRRRFEREAHHIASLSHPNIVVVHDAGIDGDHLFIVMELVKGRSLRQLLADSAPLPPPVVARLAVDVLAGLAHAHEADILHRDIKPGNILVTESGVSKLADFGIAKATEDTIDLTDYGAILGTVSYASPEQLSGDPVGPSSDLYSLGCVLYECVAGHPPFVADNLAALVHQQQFSSPEPIGDITPKVPPEIGDTIMRALEKNPSRRFDSAVTMAKAIDPSIQDGGTNALGPRQRSSRRGRQFVAVGVTILMAVALTAALVLSQRSSTGSRSYQPKLVSIPCPRGTGGHGIRCNDLVVPQDRSRPFGRQVSLLVVHAAAKTRNGRADPVLDIGNPSTESFEGTASPTRSHSDYIELTGRGGFGSNPKLSCPEENVATQDALAFSVLDKKALTQQVDAMATCRARLVSAGVVPNDYGEDAAAADVRDLVVALHLHKVNLLANGQGAQEAFIVTDKYPEIVRSVLVANPTPPGESVAASQVNGTANSFNNYVALCKADPHCSSEYPDLPGQLAADINTFNANPVTVTVTLGNQIFPVLVDGNALGVALDTALSEPAAIQTVASVIYNPDPHAIAIALAITNGFQSSQTNPLGQFYSLECKDEYPVVGATQQVLHEQLPLASNPEMAGADESFQQDAHVCPIWHVRTDPADDLSAVLNTIPTLLVYGALDPNFLPTWADEVTHGLAAAQVVRFPTLTDGDFLSSGAPACLEEIREQFLRNPTRHINVASCQDRSPPISFAPRTGTYSFS